VIPIAWLYFKLPTLITGADKPTDIERMFYYKSLREVTHEQRQAFFPLE